MSLCLQAFEEGGGGARAVAHRILAEAKAVASQKPKSEGPDPRQALHAFAVHTFCAPAGFSAVCMHDHCVHGLCDSTCTIQLFCLCSFACCASHRQGTISAIITKDTCDDNADTGVNNSVCFFMQVATVITTQCASLCRLQPPEPLSKDAVFKPGASTWNTDDPKQQHFAPGIAPSPSPSPV